MSALEREAELELLMKHQEELNGLIGAIGVEIFKDIDVSIFFKL